MPSASDLEIRAARQDDQLPLKRMLELYQYELSDIWDQELDAQGEYGYPLDRYFGRPGCQALMVMVAGHFAGFALADDAVKVGKIGHWMDQFFILKKYRRSGIGAALACQAFDALPGQWEVGQMPANVAAQAFWRQVIGNYTGGNYTEHTITSGWWQGVVQCFTSRPR